MASSSIRRSRTRRITISHMLIRARRRDVTTTMYECSRPIATWPGVRLSGSVNARGRLSFCLTPGSTAEYGRFDLAGEMEAGIPGWGPGPRGGESLYSRRDKPDVEIGSADTTAVFVVTTRSAVHPMFAPGSSPIETCYHGFVPRLRYVLHRHQSIEFPRSFEDYYGLAL